MTAVRRAAPDDARGIAEVRGETWRATYVGVVPQELLDGLDVDERERLGRRFPASTKAATFVAAREGRLVGFVSVDPSRDPEGVSTPSTWHPRRGAPVRVGR